MTGFSKIEENKKLCKIYNFHIYLQTLILAVFTAIIFFSVPLSADFGWPDAGRHAMDGMFYQDLLVDGGYLSPLKYALNYYLQYPAITPVLYPPFFGFLEIPGFTILGPYPWVARLTVSAFLWLGALGIMKLTQELLGKMGAFYAGLLYVSMPMVIFWSRDVMLEVPAMAIVIWCFYYFQHYLKHGRTKDIVYCLILATLAPYTKQNTIFIFLVFLITAIISQNKKRITDLRFMMGMLLVAICGIPLAYVTFKWGMIHFDQVFGNLKPSMSVQEHLLYYFKKLPSSIGWFIIVLCIAGIFNKKWKEYFYDKKVKITIFLLISWIIVCYLQMSLIKIKEPRHAFFWIPIFAIIASAGLQQIMSVISKKVIKCIISVIIIFGIFVFHLADCKMNWSEGFHAPAKYIANNWEGNAVLINMYGDASFVFHIRALDSEKKFRIYRSSKIFESMKIYKSWGVKSFVKNKGELFSLLSKYGIRFLLIENPMKDMTEVEQFLREICKTDKFYKVKDFPVIYPGYQMKTLSLYRYNAKIDNSGLKPVIHLPVIGIDFNENL